MGKSHQTKERQKEAKNRRKARRKERIAAASTREVAIEVTIEKEAPPPVETPPEQEAPESAPERSAINPPPTMAAEKIAERPLSIPPTTPRASILGTILALLAFGGLVAIAANATKSDEDVTMVNYITSPTSLPPGADSLLADERETVDIDLLELNEATPAPAPTPTLPFFLPPPIASNIAPVEKEEAPTVLPEPAPAKLVAPKATAKTVGDVPKAWKPVITEIRDQTDPVAVQTAGIRIAGGRMPPMETETDIAAVRVAIGIPGIPNTSSIGDLRKEVVALVRKNEWKHQ